MTPEAILMIGGAYLLGSIPFGLLFCQWLSDLDPRQHGSKNIGFTNVLRVAGWLPGLLTLAGDMGKGLLCVIIASKLTSENIILLSGLWVVLGHNYPLFLKLKGGKGVATGFGVILGINPLAGVILLILWAATVSIFRISSAGAITAFLLLPAVTWWLKPEKPYLGFAFILSIMVLVRHRSNIARLWHGQEPRLDHKHTPD